MRVCRECGKDISTMKKGAAFCGAPHRKAWNNRRMQRGAELYDLYMANRYERDKARDKVLLSVISNLARSFRDADISKREGRQSWHMQEALDRLPLAYGKDGDKR